MKRRTRSFVLLAVKLAVAGGIIAWLVASKTLTIRSFEPVLGHGGRLAACAGLLALLPLLGALRWRLLLAAQGFDVPFLRVLHLGLVGIFFNSFGVGYVGGDVVKAYYAAVEQPPGRRAEAVTSVIFDRFVGLIGLLLFALAMMLIRPDTVWQNPSAPQLRLAGLSVLTVLGALGILFALSFSRRIREGRIWALWLPRLPGGKVLLRVYSAAGVYRGRPLTVLVAVGISMVAHGVNIAMLWQISRALDFPAISPVDFAFCIAVGLAVTSVGLPLGIGAGQVAFGYLFALFFKERGNADGAALASMQQAVILFFNLAAGLPAFLLVRKDSARVEAEMAADADTTAKTASPEPAGVRDG